MLDVACARMDGGMNTLLDGRGQCLLVDILSRRRARWASVVLGLVCAAVWTLEQGEEWTRGVRTSTMSEPATLDARMESGVSMVGIEQCRSGSGLMCEW